MSGILILGGAGRLGRELDKTLHQLGAKTVVAASRAEADAADPASVLKLSKRFPGGRPDWIVCAAAWSDVPRAEVDKTGRFEETCLRPAERRLLRRIGMCRCCTTRPTMFSPAAVVVCFTLI